MSEHRSPQHAPGASGNRLSTQQFARVKDLFAELVELPAEQQTRALEQLDAEDAVINELQRLLQHATATLDGQPLQAGLSRLAQMPASGDTLGAWTLDDQIGAGGMGKVFRARRSDGHFQQHAAIKLMGGTPSAAAMRLLARERQILATLAHPNIARLLDGGSTPGGQPYLVMEFVEGLPLVEYCRRHNLATSARLQLLLEVSAAVSFAHRQLVVHCDLKPSNILVTANGRPMLLDFGISRLLGEAERSGPKSDSSNADGVLTAVGYTPRYASPEQKAGQRVGTATDVYSLGLVMAELLETPWPEHAAPMLSALPEELAAIIAMATHPEPAQRYASVEALAADLQRYLAREAVHARRPTAIYLIRKWWQRNWVLSSALASFLILLAGSAWQMRVERDNARAAERAARAVKDYMVSVFRGADPEHAGRRDLPVSHFLDAGSERLRGSLEDQPATRAELALILGTVYQSIGLRQQALVQYDEAIRLTRERRLAELLAEALHRKAYTLYDMEDLTAALPLAREALALRASRASASAEHLASLRLLGSVLSYLDESNEAEQRLQEALELALAHHGAQSIEVALARLDLARHFGAQGDRAVQVQEHASAAGDRFAQLLGPDHFRVADALEMRILGMVQSGQASAAIPHAVQLVAQRSALYGAISHPHSYALQVQGSVYWRAGQHLTAIPAFEASLAIHDELDGPEAVASLVPLFNLARTLEQAGAHGQALELLQRHRAIQQANPDNASVPDARLRLLIGRNLQRLGRLEEADGVLRELLQHNEAADAGLIIDARLNLAGIARERGALAQAQSLLDEIATEEPLRRVEWYGESARLALAGGATAAAGEHIQQALALLIEQLGEDAPETWLLRIDQAQWLKASGQTAAARQLAAEIATRLTPMIHPQGRWASLLAQLQSP